MTQALDSFGKITPASAQAARQGRFVGWLRYHYNLTDAEVRAAHDAGLWVSLIAEFDTRDWHPPVHSPEVGPRHGVTASAIARDRGFPSGSVIWLTADTFVAPSQFDKVGTYWSGAGGPIHASGYRVGAYGGSLLVDWLVDRGLADEAWECGADSWNSPDGIYLHAVRSKHAVIRQRGGGAVGGVGVDFNDVISEAAWGQWFPAGAQPPAPPPVPAPSPSPSSPTTNGVTDMAGKFLRQSDPNHADYQTVAYVGVAPGLGPDAAQSPAKFVGGLFVVKFPNLVALSLVREDDEPIHDATADQWAYLDTLPLVYQAT